MILDAKLVEIRDSGTCIPAMAIRMPCGNSSVGFCYLHRRCGYPEDGSSIMLMCLDDGKATNDPYGWQDLNMGPRTMPLAHDYIIDHYDELADGSVVDVEHILGEAPVAKAPEIYTFAL